MKNLKAIFQSLISLQTPKQFDHLFVKREERFEADLSFKQ